MLYTVNGSQVKIRSAYKEHAMLGAFLVQAEVVNPAPNGDAFGEYQNQLVAVNNPFNRGWISGNELVAEGGRDELIKTIMAAPTATPDNCENLLKLYYSHTFGTLEIISGETKANRGGVPFLRNATNQRPMIAVG